MAQGLMSSILVTIRITVRIQESEVRNPDSLAFGGGLRSLRAFLVFIFIRCKQLTVNTIQCDRPVSC